MKTDLIEIFQTIRAALQPYETLGFNDRINSDSQYDLWSEKNAELNGQQKNELLLADLKIEQDHVTLNLLPEELPEHERPMVIRELDEVSLNLIEDKVAAGYKIFKEKEWV